jgi:hypothetical protein
MGDTTAVLKVSRACIKQRKKNQINNYETVTIKQQGTKKVNKITFKCPNEEKYMVAFKNFS